MKRRRGRGEGEIRERPDGRWEARCSFGYDNLGHRVRKSVYGKSKAEVTKKLAQLALSGPPRNHRTVPTVAEFFTQYLDHVKTQNSVATWRLRSTVVRRYIAPAFGPLRLNVVTPQHIDALLRDLHRRKIGRQTIRTVHSVLNTALTYALRLELVDRNACAAIPRPRVTSERRKILSVEESQQLLATARSEDRDYSLYLLALTTGMRQGEILGLQWNHVDFDDRRVRVEGTLTEDASGCLALTRPKTASSRRSIDLPDVAVETLREHKQRQHQAGYSGPWVFPDSEGGPRRKSNFIRRSFMPLLRAAGLPHVTFHSLRHVANSVLLAQGESVKVAAERLGHSTTRMTLDTYAHVLPTTQRSAADRLDKVFRVLDVRGEIDQTKRNVPT